MVGERGGLVVGRWTPNRKPPVFEPHWRQFVSETRLLPFVLETLAHGSHVMENR